MIVTEKQAAKIRCCGSENCGAVTSEPAGGGFTTTYRACIGSKCMAWRWLGLDRSDKAKGFCGLAGQPLNGSY